MKSMVKVVALIAIAMLLVPRGAWADTPAAGGTMNVLKVSKGALALQGSYCAIEGGFTYRYFDNDDGTITLSPYDRNGMYVGAGISPSPIGDFTLPEVIDGKRVVAIGNNFFSSGMTSLALPATVTNISVYAVTDAYSLSNITVAAENPAYKSDDGILYTKDGKTLVACPRAKVGDVTIASGTERIGNYAFCYASGITSVEIPDGVKTIGAYAFEYCNNANFTSVTIPASVQSIGAYAFAYCSNLETVTFDGEMGSVDIAATAFFGTPYIKNLPFALIVESGTLVGFCGQAPETFVISNYLDGLTLTSIGSYALSADRYGASAMKRVVVPEGVTSLGSYAFAYDEALESVELPDSLRRILFDAFDYCRSLREIRIPAGVEYITGYTAFWGCTDLTVYAPSTLRDKVMVPADCTIEYYDVTAHTVTFDAKGGRFSWFVNAAGGYYTTVETATSTVVEGSAIGSLPSPWRNVMNAYFLGWYDLYGNKVTESTIVTSDLTLEARWAVDDGTFQMVVVDGVLVKCFGQCPATLSASDWPEGVTAIASYAFQSKSTLVNVEIPAGVTEIGNYAFGYCYSLTNVTIPANVTEIGDYAFGYCSSLANVTFAGGRENVDWLSDTAFYNTPYDRTLPFAMIVKDGVVTGFHGTCPSVLAASDWPEGVTAVADYAFASSGLRSVTIPAGVTSIGSGAFRGCNSLESFVVAEGNLRYKSDSRLLLTKDGHTLVAVAVSGLTSVTIPDGVTDIGDWALAYCYSLNSVVLPDSLTSIGQYAFYGSSLPSVLIPSNVTSIGNYAFAYCNRLIRAYLPKRLEGAVDEAFIFQNYSQPVAICYYEGVTPTLFNVTFNANGGYCNFSSVTYLLGNAIGTLPTAYKDYNQFVGWFTAAEGGEQVTAETILPAGVTTLYAHWKENDPEWYYDWDFDDDDSPFVWLWGYSLPLSGDVVFPATLPVEMEDEGGNVVTNDVPVRYIGGFDSCYGLRSITIPNSVISIDEYAFGYCSRLTNVVIGSGVTSIGDYAFGYCSRLRDVTFEGDMVAIDMIVGFAFWGTPWLDKQPFGWLTYELEGEVYLIGHYGSPVPMETLVIPDGIAGIIYEGGKNSGLPRFDTQWDGEKYWRFLGWYTAADGGERVDPVNWWNYSEVAIAGGTTLYAHWEETEPEWYFEVENGEATIVGNSVLLVGDVEIPTSVTVEEEDGNGDMVEVSYPVTAIGESAFYGMDGITTVSIPTSVVRVGYEAFYGCSESLFDTETIPGVKLVDGWAVGYTEEPLGDLSLTGVRGIGGCAFEDCEGLISVTIPDGVTSICEGAFYDCDSLTNVTIQADVTSIGEYAFSYCIGLTSLAIPDSVMSIGDSAFEGCRGLTSVTFDGNAPEVGENAFEGVSEECTAYVRRGSTGWGVDIPGTWNGMRIEYSQADSIPVVANDADTAMVNATIDGVGFVDAAVKEVIGGSAEEYNAFKAWAGSVKGAVGDTLAGEAAVVANAHAAAAYLLGAERLFVNEPTVEIGEMAVADGESAGTTAMTVVVTVKDGENAVKCAAEKVKEMFEATGDLGDWTGAAKLTPKVDISGTDASGKMTFVVTPGDGTADRAFLRIKR